MKWLDNTTSTGDTPSTTASSTGELDATIKASLPPGDAARTLAYFDRCQELQAAADAQAAAVAASTSHATATKVDRIANAIRAALSHRTLRAEVDADEPCHRTALVLAHFRDPRHFQRYADEFGITRAPGPRSVRRILREYGLI